MPARAFITGLAGPNIRPEERSFLREAAPWALILFKRNIEERAQVISLVDSFREAVGWRAPVLIDQEGGRVQRLGPPQWPVYPSGATYGRIYDRDADAGLSAARLGARLIASDLADLGIDVDCLPVADLPVADADPVIGERAYGTTPDKVARLAGAAAAGLAAGGVLPVLKHIPGHGRATADSHLRLPVVETDRATLETTDFAPFRALNGLPLAMTAHIVFTALDPVAPATTSPGIINMIRTSIGFDGLLMSDDIAMGALAGSIGARSAAAIVAGCDVVLHCNGQFAEMAEVAATVPELAGPSLARAEAALAARRTPEPLDVAAARAEFARLIDEHPVAPRIVTA
jgi:beta-N-acetylhexosaminidase